MTTKYCWDWTGSILQGRERILRFPSDTIQLDNHLRVCDDDYDDTGHIAAIDLADSMDIEADIDWDLADID